MINNIKIAVLLTLLAFAVKVQFFTEFEEIEPITMVKNQEDCKTCLEKRKLLKPETSSG